MSQAYEGNNNCNGSAKKTETEEKGITDTLRGLTLVSGTNHTYGTNTNHQKNDSALLGILAFAH